MHGLEMDDPPAQANAKRPAAAAKTPQPAKRAKAESGQVASAPAKVPAGAAKGASHFSKALPLCQHS